VAALGCLALAPAALATPTLASLTVAPNPIAPNGTTTGTVTLSEPAAGDTTLSLSVAPSSAASVQTTVTVPSGQTSAQFPATDLGTSSSWSLTAQLNADTASQIVYVQTPADHAVINEVDYDEPGTDSGEFVEVFNPTGSTIDLHHLALAFASGATGSEYLRVSLAPARCLPPGSYAVVADDAVSVPSSAAVVRLAAASGAGNIRNSGANGVALIDTQIPSLIDGLWYQGTNDTDEVQLDGFANPISLVEGTHTTIADSNTVPQSLDREPNGLDTDDAQSDWTTDAAPSPGVGNGDIGGEGSTCPDNAPTLDAIGPKSVEAGHTLSFAVSASDPDSSDQLTYSASDLPSGASFDSGTREFSWTPTADQVGSYSGVHFEVSDGFETDAEDVTITVTAQPAAPLPPGSPLQTAPAPPVLAAATPPGTKMGKVKIDRRRRSVTFRFSSDQASAGFLCKLDKNKFARCRSPKTYKHLKPGRHVFQVKASDAAGTDRTPAVKKLTLKRWR
jgi:hypothetical protein